MLLNHAGKRISYTPRSPLSSSIGEKKNPDVQRDSSVDQINHFQASRATLITAEALRDVPEIDTDYTVTLPWL